MLTLPRNQGFTLKSSLSLHGARIRPCAKAVFAIVTKTYSITLRADGGDLAVATGVCVYVCVFDRLLVCMHETYIYIIIL